MRHYPEDKYDNEIAEDINPKDWQLEILKVNPEYCPWGNHEGYMAEDDRGWASRTFVDNWEDFQDEWELNDLNEVVNFYFAVNRDNKECEHCEGKGLNQETLEIEKSFYNHDGIGKGWSKNLTDEDIEVLAEFRDLTFEEAKKRGNGEVLGMDALDRFELVEHRARKKGVYGNCKYCDGSGRIYTGDKPKLQLQLWVLHPRKGCSRGVLIDEIKRNEIPKVFEFLNKARKRNEDRFSSIDKSEDVKYD